MWYIELWINDWLIYDFSIDLEKGKFYSKGKEIGRYSKYSKELEALKEIISEIRGFKVGININDSDAAYDVALYSSFDTRQDLDSYQRHEKHKEAADWVAKVRLQRIVVDYEV